jgi:hypothetical protein
MTGFADEDNSENESDQIRYAASMKFLLNSEYDHSFLWGSLRPKARAS